LQKIHPLFRSYSFHFGPFITPKPVLVAGLRQHTAGVSLVKASAIDELRGFRGDFAVSWCGSQPFFGGWLQQSFWLIRCWIV
jgi:hypothetical protein